MGRLKLALDGTAVKMNSFVLSNYRDNWLILEVEKTVTQMSIGTQGVTIKSIVRNHLSLNHVS